MSKTDIVFPLQKQLSHFPEHFRAQSIFHFPISIQACNTATNKIIKDTPKLNNKHKDETQLAKEKKDTNYLNKYICFIYIYMHANNPFNSKMTTYIHRKKKVD